MCSLSVLFKPRRSPNTFNDRWRWCCCGTTEENGVLGPAEEINSQKDNPKLMYHRACARERGHFQKACQVEGENSPPMEYCRLHCLEHLATLCEAKTCTQLSSKKPVGSQDLINEALHRERMELKSKVKQIKELLLKPETQAMIRKELFEGRVLSDGDHTGMLISA